MSDSYSSVRIVSFGSTLLSAVAGYLSWCTNHSLGWALWHFVCGFFYLCYRAFGYGGPMPW